MKRHCSLGSYPMNGASPVPMAELGYVLYPTKRENNHHYYFTASAMARFILTQTLRDLDRHQQIAPIVQHVRLHDDWGAPDLPTPREAMDVIDEAFQLGEQLRFGSAHNPIYKPITPELMTRLGIEYGALV